MSAYTKIDDTLNIKVHLCVKKGLKNNHSPLNVSYYGAFALQF